MEGREQLIKLPSKHDWENASRAARVNLVYRLAAGFYDLLSPIWVNGYPEAYAALDQAYLKYLPQAGRILDLGCGTAANLGRLIDCQMPFSSYIGVDQSEEMLAQARAKYGNVQEASFRRLNLQNDPLPAGPFELVISTWVFEHLYDPIKVAEKAIGRLSPGGRVILMLEVSANRWREWLLGPLWRACGASLMPLEALNGFPDIISLEQFEGIGPTLALAVLGDHH